MINNESADYLCLDINNEPGCLTNQTNAPYSEQMWRFEYVDGYYKIINMTNDYILSSTSETVSSTSTNTDHNDHLWQIKIINGSYAIIPKSYPSKYLKQSGFSVELSSEFTTACGWSIQEYVCDNYFDGNINGGNTTLYWYVEDEVLSVINESLFTNAINAWDNISSFSFSRVTDLNSFSGNIYITFELGSIDWDAEAQMIPYVNNNSEIEAESNQDYARTKIEIYLKNNAHWRATDSANIEYNTAILMHEIGHALKLAHPAESETDGLKYLPAVMQTLGIGGNFTHEITNYDKSALIHKWEET